MSFDRQLYEQMVHGEFGAVLSTLASIKTLADSLTTQITAMNAAVNGTSGAPVSTTSFVGTLHSPARLDPSTQTSIEKFVGDYFVGDQESSTDSQAETQSARIAVGPTSEMLLNYLPTKSNHAVPKRFVENLVSPLYAKIAALTNTTKEFTSRAMTPSSVPYIYLSKIFTNINTNLSFSSNDIKLSSGNCADYFNIASNSIQILQSGLYLVSISITDLASGSNTNSFAVRLNGNEISTIHVTNSSSSILLPICVTGESSITWEYSDIPTDLTLGLSLTKLGEANV